MCQSRLDVKADSDKSCFEFVAEKHCGNFFVEQNKRNVTAKQKFSDTLSEMAWNFFDIVLKIRTMSEKWT